MSSRSEEFMNVMKQAKIIGGASSQVSTFRFPIMDEPPLWMQRTPAPYFMNGQSEMPRKRFAYESPIEELDYDRSVVPMEKPLGKSCSIPISLPEAEDEHEQPEAKRRERGGYVYRRWNRNPGAHDGVISSSSHEAAGTLTGID
ncbi:hypothetical protein M9H77_06468 [Catharanthus roseus]|uniref:Uncharacterized protein n=1 Tax=Catharanthus roseus TaxID=4058 RepID=A0ACC0BS75_CATRO|nr:hypothetical protein M9H77_06468 [Catharanthus roseus]